MGAGFKMAAINRIGLVDGGELRQAGAQTGPALGDHDAVVWVAGLVAHGAGKSGAHFGGVNDVTHGGNFLRALIVHAADAVAEEEEGQRSTLSAIDVVD